MPNGWACKLHDINQLIDVIFGMLSTAETAISAWFETRFKIIMQKLQRTGYVNDGFIYLGNLLYI